MADTTHQIGSSGIVKKLVEVESGVHADAVVFMAPLAGSSSSIGQVDIDDIAPYPNTPTVTVYTPSTTAYVKVTPAATLAEMVVRARTTSDDLYYAALVTHKIADATTIAAADATDLATSKTLIDEIDGEAQTHIASTAYHIAAGEVIYPGHKAADTTNTTAAADMSDLATGYVLADELEADLIAHGASTTYHIAAATIADMGDTPNSEATLVTKVNLIRTAAIAHYAATANHYVADYENNRLATATTAATDTASAQTLINLLKAYWNSHCGVGAAAAADLAAVIAHANAHRTGLLVHLADTASHGGIADATNLATLTAVASATNLATAQTLITALKAALNSHYVKTDNGAYVTVPAGTALNWSCLGSFFCRTSTSGGTFTTTEFLSV